VNCQRLPSSGLITPLAVVICRTPSWIAIFRKDQGCGWNTNFLMKQTTKTLTLCSTCIGLTQVCCLCGRRHVVSCIPISGLIKHFGLQGLPAILAHEAFAMFLERPQSAKPPSAYTCKALLQFVTVMSRSYKNIDGKINQALLSKMALNNHAPPQGIQGCSRGAQQGYMQDFRHVLAGYLQGELADASLAQSNEPRSVSRVCPTMLYVLLLCQDWPLSSKVWQFNHIHQSCLFICKVYR